ncbi:MAG: hypothetical protein QGD88_04495 [Anaerolineae bacterium]|nr:hypothetical protein [Anaerolineae bacterium]
MQRNFKYLLIVLVLVVILGAAFALAAANTIPASTAGAGASAVGGYTVSNIAYDLDAVDPSIVDAITFSLSPDAGSDKALAVFLQTVAAGSWTTCTLVDGVAPAVDATCTYGVLALSAVTELNIVANGTVDPNP